MMDKFRNFIISFDEKKVIIAGILLIVTCLFIREYEHKREVNALQKQLIESGTIDKKNVKPAPMVKEVPEGGSSNNYILSGAGNISSNQAKDFTKQVVAKEQAVEKGKAKNLYEFESNLNTADTIRQIRQNIANKTSSKEVNNADFVTVEQEKTKDVGGTVSTKVKVNAFYNYKPSIYYVPQLTPDTFKRHDIIYTNRDTLISISYDNRREGEGFKDKLGVSVGWRIKSW